MKKIAFLLISLLIFSSCSEERKDAVVSKSPDGNLTLTISGKRENFISPWITNMVAKGKALNGNVSFEFYGKDLNDKTIQFVWDGNEKCTITFIQRDGTTRIFEFIPNSTERMWRDLSPK